jgi:hypothetical protein
MASIDEHDRKLIGALRSLCQLAHVNWPRDTDIHVSTGSGHGASGKVTIPARLLERILSEAESGERDFIQRAMRRD